MVRPISALKSRLAPNKGFAAYSENALVLLNSNFHSHLAAYKITRSICHSTYEEAFSIGVQVGLETELKSVLLACLDDTMGA